MDDYPCQEWEIERFYLRNDPKTALFDHFSKHAFPRAVGWRPENAKNPRSWAHKLLKKVLKKVLFSTLFRNLKSVPAELFHAEYCVLIGQTARKEVFLRTHRKSGYHRNSAILR